MSKDKTKMPKCYECKHRRPIPGDAHSWCAHPEVCGSTFFGALFYTLKGTNSDAMKKLGVKGNAYGIKSGLFNWPANSDPVWLEECNGFEMIESDE